MGEKKGDSNITTVIFKVDMHCDGCASKIIRHLRSLQGVDTVKAESETGKITVTGNVDPTKLKDNLEKKIKKKVELISPVPQLNKENSKNNNKTDKKKIEDKKDKETMTTTVLKVALHCQGCIESIGKTVKKTKGVKEMSIDKEKDTITVQGTMDVKSLVNNLTEKLKRKVEVVPPKKEKKNEEEGNNNQNENLEQSRMEYNIVQHQHQPPYGFGYGYGYGHGYGNSGGYNYGPVYPEQFHLHMQHAQPPPPPPQMFSDENPNACSLM